MPTGYHKRVFFKVGTAPYGTFPTAGGFQEWRRVEFGVGNKPDVFESQEITNHMQLADVTRGMDRISGGTKHELSLTTYAPQLAALVRRAWVAKAPLAGLTLTIAASGQLWSITRSAGSYLADGLKIGDVWRLTVGAFAAANLNKNLLVLGVTAAVLTVMPLNRSPMAAEGPIAAATMAYPGQGTFMPNNVSAMQDLWFDFEAVTSDPSVTSSMLVYGCRPTKCQFQYPPKGNVSLNFDWLGKGWQLANAQYAAAPTAPTNTPLISGLSGFIVVGAQVVAGFTGLSYDVTSEQDAPDEVGATEISSMDGGMMMVKGQVTAKFRSLLYRDMFYSATEFVLIVASVVDKTANAGFFVTCMPRCELTGREESESTKATIETLPFTAQFNRFGGVGLPTLDTTISFQDSAL